MDLAPGVVVAERYLVDRKIGKGGMAEVWGGQHLVIGCRVAIKRLLPARALRHDLVTRFKREAFFLGRVESDYVARILDFVTDPALGLVLIMEFVDGEPLSNVLRRRKLAVEEALELGADLASALVDLHKSSVVHRDLKPANIILRPLPSGRTRAVLVDFGVSRLLPEGKKSGGSGPEDTMTRLTRHNVALGTIEYMAPEQVLNSRDASERSDLYAVGAILYRAVAGRHIFGRLEGGHLARTKISIPAPLLETGRTDKLAVAFGEVVAKALQRRPAERHTCAQELLDELNPLREIARLASLDVETTFGGEQTRRMSVRELLGEALAAENGGDSPGLDPVDEDGRGASAANARDEAAVAVAGGGTSIAEESAATPQGSPRRARIRTDRARPRGPIPSSRSAHRSTVGVVDDDSSDAPTARTSRPSLTAAASNATATPSRPAAASDVSGIGVVVVEPAARPPSERPKPKARQPLGANAAPSRRAPSGGDDARHARGPLGAAVAVIVGATLLGVLLAIAILPESPPATRRAMLGVSVVATAAHAAGRVDRSANATAPATAPAIDSSPAVPAVESVALSSAAAHEPIAIAAAEPPRRPLTGRLPRPASTAPAAPIAPEPSAAIAAVSGATTVTPAAATARPATDPDVYE